MKGPPHLLLAGWFSVSSDGNTAGDLLALQTVARWLDELSTPFTVAVSDIAKYSGVLNRPMIRTEEASGGDADALVWVCGPLLSDSLKPLIESFAGKPRLALGISLTDPGAERLFDTVVARDRAETRGVADLSFGSRTQPVPVIGLIYVGPQPEYRQQHEMSVREAVETALASADVAVVHLDTRLPIPANPLRTPGELESVIARMDVVLTTRLHGAVLALRNGVPAIAIDPVLGGAKLTAQMNALGWPLTTTADRAGATTIHTLLDRALHEDLSHHLMRIRETPASALALYRSALLKCIDNIADGRRYGAYAGTEVDRSL